MKNWPALKKNVDFKIYNLNNVILDYGRGYIYQASNASLDDRAYRFQSLSSSKFITVVKKYPSIFPDSEIHNLNNIIYVPVHANFYHMMIDYIPRLYAAKLDDRPVVICKTVLDYLPNVFDAIKDWFPNCNFNFIELQKPYEIASHVYKGRLVGNNIGIFSSSCKKPSAAFTNNKIFAVGFWQNWYAEHFNQTKQYRRIFLYRESLDKIRLQNQDEIYEKLEKLGFEKVNPNNYSLRELAKIMNSAREVIGAHGAGLTNIVFCQPKTKFLQLANNSGSEIFYSFLASICEFKYSCIYGYDSKNLQQIYDNNAEFKINLDDVVNLL